MKHRSQCTDHRPLRTGHVYRHGPRRKPGQIRAADAYWETYKDAFNKRSRMVTYLDALTMPASGKWAYGRIPKTGTNSTLAALHFLEFSHPLSTEIRETNSASEDTAPHRLDEAGIFMTPLQSTHNPDVLEAAFRFTVLRDPAARAASSFGYLCNSHRKASRQLAPVRLRMTAMTGFDWDADLDSLTGFQKFLDFVEASQSIGRYQLDRHVAPQSTSMPKDIFKPHIVGRIEEYGAFLQALAAEFGVAKLPDYLRTTTRNAIPKAAPIKLIPAIRRRIATVFAEDLDWYESL